jgi:hypothetical protein
VAGGAAIAGYFLTKVLPEPSQRSLEDISGDDASFRDPDPQAVLS